MNHISSESFGNIFSSITYLAGVIFFVTGLILFIFPPKRINSIYGYRTTRSKKNQKIWVFAQRYSAILMLKLGLISGLVYGLSLLDFLKANLSETSELVLGIGFLVIIFATLFIKVEMALKRKLSEESVKN